jgi:hypothetical protein
MSLLGFQTKNKPEWVECEFVCVSELGNWLVGSVVGAARSRAVVWEMRVMGWVGLGKLRGEKCDRASEGNRELPELEGQGKTSDQSCGMHEMARNVPKVPNDRIGLRCGPAAERG